MLKLAVFSANYRPPGQLDSYRGGLLRFLSASGIRTLFVQASDFIDDREGRPLFSGAVQLIRQRMRNFAPDGVLFINGAGRIGEIQQLLNKLKIPSVSWFVDHPSFFAASLLTNQENHIDVAANKTFVRWFKNQMNRDVEYVPFPCAFSDDLWQKRERDLGALFMGTMWDLHDVPYWVRLHEQTTGMPIDFEEFYHELRSFFAIKNSGETPDPLYYSGSRSFLFSRFGSEAAFMSQISNYFSTLDRVKFLSPLTNLDLSLYGPRPGWGLTIGAGYHEFIRPYRNTDIVSPAELFAVCRRARVGINIFHVQNQGGGLNFRFAEYIQSGTPILSNRNQECEKEFPHNEAALYFDEPAAFRDACERLLNDERMADRMAKNAFEISRANFDIRSITKTLLAKMSLEVRTPFRSKEEEFQMFTHTRPYSNKGLRRFPGLVEWVKGTRLHKPLRKVLYGLNLLAPKQNR